MRVCTKCQEEKEESEFYKKSDGYFTSKCKKCTCDEHKEVRAKTKVKTEYEILLESGRKRCSDCGEVKSVEMFYKKRKSYEHSCKLCKNRKTKQRFAENPELSKLRMQQQKKRAEENPEVKLRMSEYGVKYYQENKDKHNAWVKDWYERNPGKALEYGRKWRQANPDAVRFHANKRRTRKINATPGWSDTEWEQFFIKEIYHLAKIREEVTGHLYHVDHIVPLKSDLVCGLHCSSNLQLLPAAENISKSNRYWPNMP